jgi:choline dehydrogenase
LAQWGNVTGGGTTVNALINIRGDFKDFKRYPLSFNRRAMLRAYKKAEDAMNVLNAQPPLRGFDGPYILENNDLFSDGYAEAVIASAVNQGFPQRDDLNGAGNPFGAGFIQAQIKNGQRNNAYQAYVLQAPSSVAARITTLTGARVERVLLSLTGRRARGVVYVDSEGIEHTELASKGVVLAAGAIFSPTILEKSGIGSPDILDPLGIPVRGRNDHVGEHLQDHLGYTMFFITTPSPYTNVTFLAEQQALYVANQTGLFASPSVNALVFMKELGSEVVNGALQCVQGQTLGLPGPNGTTTFVTVVQTYALDVKSVGQVHVGPGGSVIFDPRYASRVEDLELLAQVAQRTRQILLGSGRAFGQLDLATGAVITDPNFLQTPEELRQTLIQNAGGFIPIPYSGLHYTGSLSLGKVVNPRTMRVMAEGLFRNYDIEGLYVVDASVIPITPKANTALPTIAVAERASEIILY